MRTFISAKIHDVRVTSKSLAYSGSVTVCRELLAAVDIVPYERVEVVNLENGARWATYAIPGKPGVFELNGGGARLGEVGDRCIVMAFRQGGEFGGAQVVYCDEQNSVARQGVYP